MNARRAATILSMLIATVAGSTVFFRLAEGWSWVDSYFFTVVTLSTVGYGNIVPVTTLGKIGTTVVIFLGLGVFALAIQQFTHFAVKRREEHSEWLIGRLRHAPPVRRKRAGRTGQPGQPARAHVTPPWRPVPERVSGRG